MTTLSNADRRILQEIQRDASLSTKDLAEKAGLSPTTVWRRLQDLKAAGVVRQSVTLADPEKLGLEICNIVEVTIADQTPESRADFERFVEVNDNILQCSTVAGTYDYLLLIRTHTVKEFEYFLMNELLAHASVQSTQSSLVLRQTKNTTYLPV